MPKIKNFSFILSPATIGQLRDAWPVMRLVPDFIIKSSAGIMPPFKILRRRVRSISGSEIDGYVIVCPLLGGQSGRPKDEFILDKIISAGHIAERLRSKILGLGGCGAVLSAQAYNKILASLKIPLTSGNTLTAWSIVEALYRAAKAKKIFLKESIVAIAGANTCIGRLCALKLPQFARQVITDGQEQGFEKADIVINLSEPNEAPIDINNLKHRIIFCELSPAGRLSEQAKSRGDITVIEAGLIKLPNGDIISAAMAEEILLALEERFVNYSAADNINPDKLEEIADLAARHGFEIYIPAAPVG